MDNEVRTLSDKRRLRRGAVAAASLLLTALAAYGVATGGLRAEDAPAAAALPAPGNSLTMKPGREFAADSYVHKPLAPDAGIDPKSAVWVAELQRQIKKFYGVASVNIDKFSPPLYVVGPDQPTVRVKAARRSDPKWSFAPFQQQMEAVPLPDGFAPSPGTDKEAIVYQPSTGRYWEFWLMEKSGAKVKDSAGREVDEWQAAWGGRIDDLGKSPGYFPTTPQGYKFGTTATGLPLLAGLMTIEEQKSGRIEHALHFAIPEARKWSVWAHPAQRSDGHIDSEDAIPEGVTFRLPADLDLDKLPLDPYARMIARAVQKYGMVLRDKSGAVVFYAENPAGRYPAHPYFGPGGILRCPQGVHEWACAPDTNNRLRNFPWDKLQAVKAKLNR